MDTICAPLNKILRKAMIQRTHFKEFFLGCTLGSCFVLFTYHMLMHRMPQPPLPVNTPEPVYVMHYPSVTKVNDTFAKKLEKEVRVLCWIMTFPRNLKKKAIHVKNTWARRCNVLLFMSTQNESTLPAIGINVPDGKDRLTEKQLRAFEYVYEKYYDKADWFMKADDDSYVILENLRHFLYNYSTEEPIYFGHHFKPFVKQGYLSGGAGYVISKEALRRLIRDGIKQNKCKKAGPIDDVEFGLCMETLGVKIINTTDSKGRNRFNGFSPETMLHAKLERGSYESYDANGAKQGPGAISDYPISFHYVVPQQMYDLEFFIYHVRVHGDKGDSG